MFVFKCFIFLMLLNTPRMPLPSVPSQTAAFPFPFGNLLPSPFRFHARPSSSERSEYDSFFGGSGLPEYILHSKSVSQV